MLLAGCTAVFGVDDLEYQDGKAVEEIVEENDDAGAGGMAAASSTAATGGTSEVTAATCESDGMLCLECVNSDCAGDRCEAELEGCIGDAACLDANSCYNACAETDWGCRYRCLLEFLPGVEKLFAWNDCLFCEADTCEATCTVAGQCPQPDPCYQCMYSEKALAACKPQWEACVAEPDCLDIEACWAECPANDVNCVNDCHTVNATGSTEYSDLWQCIQCTEPACADVCFESAGC
jgi:hypothetical protein